jgi:hypothetical protein
VRRACALVVILVAGFALGFAGCGEDDDGSPGQGTEPGMTDGTTTEEDDGNGVY